MASYRGESIRHEGVCWQNSRSVCPAWQFRLRSRGGSRCFSRVTRSSFPWHVDFWFGQGAPASRPCCPSKNGRDARSPWALAPQFRPNHTRRARVQGLPTEPGCAGRPPRFFLLTRATNGHPIGGPRSSRMERPAEMNGQPQRPFLGCGHSSRSSAFPKCPFLAKHVMNWHIWMVSDAKPACETLDSAVRA